jgi:hypothetical protein
MKRQSQEALMDAVFAGLVLLLVLLFFALIVQLLWADAAMAQANTWQVLSPTPTTRWVPDSFTDCTATASTANGQITEHQRR